MNSPLPYKSLLAIEGVVSGVTQVAVIPAPLRGELTKIVVKQMTGASEGYTFSLLDRPPIDDDLSPVDPDVWSEETTRLVGPTTVNAGQTTYSSDLNPRVAFQAWQLSQVIPGDSRASYLYLKILAAGTGEKSFELALQTMLPS
jgi:hypothetical protein